jgi:hypothetical protein
MIGRTANNAPVATLGELETPCLILEADRMDRNIARLRGRLDGFDVSLRPHLKTAKSVEVATTSSTERRSWSRPSGRGSEVGDGCDRDPCGRRTAWAGTNMTTLVNDSAVVSSTPARAAAASAAR